MIDTAVILAAGRGTRLSEITRTRSKAMAPVVGQPMIGRVIEMLRAAGVERFIIITAPHDRELLEFAAQLPSVQVRVQQQPRGSGDALRACSGDVTSDFVVCACDSLVPVDHARELIAAHRSGACAATISVMEVSPEQSLATRSVVKLHEGYVVDLIEKPSESERISNVTALPMYVVSSSIFRDLETLAISPRGEYELPSVFRKMISEGQQIRAVTARERFDLTSLSDLFEINMVFLQRMNSTVVVHPSVVIPTDTTFTGPVLIEEGCYVGAGANIGPFVYLERGATVAAGSSLRRLVVTRGCEVSGEREGVVIT